MQFPMGAPDPDSPALRPLVRLQGSIEGSVRRASATQYELAAATTLKIRLGKHAKKVRAGMENGAHP